MGRAVAVGETAILEGDEQLIQVEDGPLVFDDAVALRFSEQYRDPYDEIVVFTTFRDVDMARAYFRPAQLKVLGLGRALFDDTKWFGYNGQLLGVADMKTEHLDEPDVMYSVLGQEFAHAWLAHLRFVDGSGAVSNTLLDNLLWHWNELVHTEGSVMGGNDWNDSADGTFTIQTQRNRYSPLDLYGMGLLPPTDVPPWFYIDGATTLGGVPVDPYARLAIGMTVQGARVDVSIDDVIAAEGPRVPDASSAPHQWRVAFVLLTRPGERAEDVIAMAERVDEIRAGWPPVFAAMTGGHGAVCTRLSAPCGEPGAVVVAATIEDLNGQPKETLDPGEQAFLRLTLRNDGDEPAEGVAVTASVDSGVSIEGPVSAEAIPAGAFGSARLPLTVARDEPCATSFAVWTETTTGPWVSRGLFLFDVGREALYRYAFEEENEGWAVNPYGTDTVPSTDFVRAVPSNGELPPIDATRQGRYAFVTGTGRDAGRPNDTDGVSTLLSPALDLSTRSVPVLRFSYWVYAADYMRDVSEEDDLLVEASADDGATWVELARLWDDSLTWKRFEVPLEEHLVPSSRTRVRFTARDRGPDNTVEVGVDDVEILVPTPACGGTTIDPPPPILEEGCGCAVGGEPRRRGTWVGFLFAMGTWCGAWRWWRSLSPRLPPRRSSRRHGGCRRTASREGRQGSAQAAATLFALALGCAGQTGTDACSSADRRPCGSDEGACSAGQQVCTDGVWSECMGGQGPVPEICNGIDDDCSGQADEPCCTPQDWGVESVGPGNEVSMVVDMDGGVHLAYWVTGLDYAYRARGTGIWEEATADPIEQSYVKPTAIAVADDTIRIGYERTGQFWLAKKDPAGSWVNAIVDPSRTLWNASLAVGAGDVEAAWVMSGELLYTNLSAASKPEFVGPARQYAHTSLVTDSRGEVHVLYYDGRLSYAYRTADGVWARENVDVADTGRCNALAIDRDDVLHAVYSDAARGWVRYARFEGGQWAAEDLAFGDAAWTGCAIAVDAEGAIHVAHGVDPDEEVWYHTRAPGGDWDWIVLGAGRWAGMTTAIATDDFGGVHVAFEADSTIQYAYRCPER